MRSIKVHNLAILIIITILISSSSAVYATKKRDGKNSASQSVVNSKKNKNENKKVTKQKVVKEKTKNKTKLKHQTNDEKLYLINLPANVPLEGKLHKIHILWTKNRYNEIIEELKSCSNSEALEPFRLYLLAQAEKDASIHHSALKNYKTIFTTYPKSYFAQMALYEYIILNLKLFNNQYEQEILALTSKINSKYLKCKVYEKIAQNYVNDNNKKIAYLLKAFETYAEDKYYFDTYQDVRDIIFKIIKEPIFLLITKNETIILLAFLADKFKLIQELEQTIDLAIATINKDFTPLKLLIAAISAKQQKNYDQALNLIDSLLSNSKLKEPKNKSYIYAIRFIKADFYEKNNYYIPAIAEYKLAYAYAETIKQKQECLYRIFNCAAEAEYHSEAIEALQKLFYDYRVNIHNLPNKIYQYGLKCYDTSKYSYAVMYFETLFKYFPEHYRADDAIGYILKCSSYISPTININNLISLMQRKYFYSFFNYWIFPTSRNSHFSIKDHSIPNLTKQLKEKLKLWKILIKSPFSDLANKDIFYHLENHPSIEIFYIAGLAFEHSKNYFMLTAVGKRLLEWFYKSNYEISKLPEWGWYFIYPRPYWENIVNEANKYNIDPYWILSIMREESHFNPRILSRSNAHGLMQILPSTGKWIAEKLGMKGKIDKEKLFDIELNISMGAWYLRFLLDYFGGNFYLATAAYNAGQGNIRRFLENTGYSMKLEEGHGEIQMLNQSKRADIYLDILDKIHLTETRDYYKKVLGSYWTYKRLYSHK